VSSNDLLCYWEQDERTKVILLYLESFGNPRNFSRVARRVARVKPIIAVKSGRTPAGARATGSHTGALIAESDVTVDALFRQAGVIRTDTLAQMFDVASLLAHQRPPRGRRVAILTNAGGPGILCADACVAEGLEMAGLSEATRLTLRATLSPSASVQNPVDMIASATAEQYRETMRIVGGDAGVDAMIVIFVPPLVTSPEDAARAIAESARALGGDIPVLTVFMQSRGTPETLRSGELQLPSFAFPEDAAIALGRAAIHGDWLRRPDASPPRFEGLRAGEAAAVIAAARARDAEWLQPNEVATVLSAYGLPVTEQQVADTPAAAARAAAMMGGTLALNVTNRFLDLEPAVTAAARANGFDGVIGVEKDVPIGPASDGKTNSRWIFLRRVAMPESLVKDSRFRALRPDAGDAWTDDHASIVGAIRLGGP